jgi:hypothetical protein
MTRAESVVLAAVAVVLIGTIGFELDASSGEGNTRTEAAVRPRSPTLAEQAPSAQDRGQEWVATILARPLFSRGRRPLATPGETGALPTKELPRLAGILVSPLGKAAIFAAADGGKPMVVVEGGHLGRFIVKSIDIGQVTMIGPEGQRLLRPSFDNTASPGPPVASGSPAPRNSSGQIR